MQLRTLLAATAVSALAIGAGVAPAHSEPLQPPAKAGTVVAWGDSTEISSASAIPIPDDLTVPVVDVSAGPRATGVVTADGRVRVWGSAAAPEVALTPDVTDATAIVVGASHAAIIHADGHVTAWGEQAPFSDVPEDLRAKAIAVQSGTGYAVRPDGTLTYWGNAPFGPLPPAGMTDLVDVSAKLAQVVALHADGTVTAWGFDIPGLNDVPDFGGKKAVKITTGYFASGAVLEDGTIKTWGPAAPTGEPTFAGTTPATKVVDLALGTDFGVALTADGKVHAWGSKAPLNDVPASLTGRPVTEVTAGENHAAAVITDFRDVTKPTVAGEPEVGQTLTATPATFSLTPDAPATGQWYAGDDALAGQTGTTLTLDDSLVGRTITYRTGAHRAESPRLRETVVSVSKVVGPVRRARSTTQLTVSPATAGTTRTLTATVTRAGGAPTGMVTLKIGTSTWTDVLTGGKASWTLPLTAGSRSATAFYSGDDTTKPSTAAATPFRVTKATSKVSAKAKKAGKNVNISVRVKTPKGVSPTGKVTVSVTGHKPATATVNAHGKATVTIRKASRGKHTAKVTYTGNDGVSGSKGSVKFKV